MVYSSRLLPESESGIDFSCDHMQYLERAIPEPVKSRIRDILEVSPNLLPPIRMSEIASSDKVQSFHGSKTGEFFQTHVLAGGPAVRAMHLEVGKNTHENVSNVLTASPVGKS